MTSASVNVERHDERDLVVAHLHGDIDSSNATATLLPLTEVVAPGQRLVLDLSDLKYIDSAGMAEIEKLRRNTNLAIVAPRSSVLRRAIEIVAFDQLGPMVERLDDIGSADS